MTRFLRFLPSLAALALLAVPARALLNIDGSRNQIFVFGQATFAYSSNIFATSGGDGDYSTSAQAGFELQRRRGIIAVNCRGTVTHLSYSNYKGESSTNPNFSLELNKTGGRTTGAFTVNAYRESRSDSAVNVRTNSWNFPLGLNLKYPVNDNLYVTSNTGYQRRSYSDTTSLNDYTDYSQAIDLFYIYTSKTDLLGGYRVRIADTSTGGSTTDHSFSIGATGGLFAKLNGLFRVGYQIREQEATNETFNQFTLSAALDWALTRKFSLKLQGTRDFSTTALGGSVDSASGTLAASYVFSRKFSVDASVGGGRNEFLGRVAPARTDHFALWDLGARYSLNEHFRLGASLNYFKNWSSLPTSDFHRFGYSIDVYSRF